MTKYIDVDKFKKSSLTWLDGTCLVVAVEELDRAPAADVAPVVHAHWEEYWDDNYLSWCHKCSNCGSFPLTKEETMHDEVLSAYCPHCGAKMKRGNKNDL